MFNYLTRHPSSIPIISFTPGEIAIYSEKFIVNILQTQSPEFILLVHRNTSGFNVGIFGTDPNYGKRIVYWVMNHYAPVVQYGADPLKNGDFGIKLLKLLPPFSK